MKNKSKKMAKGKKPGGTVTLAAPGFLPEQTLTLVGVTGNQVELSWTLPDNPKFTFIQKSLCAKPDGRILLQDGCTLPQQPGFYQPEHEPDVTGAIIHQDAGTVYYRVAGTDISNNEFITNTVLVTV